MSWKFWERRKKKPEEEETPDAKEDADLDMAGWSASAAGGISKRRDDQRA